MSHHGGGPRNYVHKDFHNQIVEELKTRVAEFVYRVVYAEGNAFASSCAEPEWNLDGGTCDQDSWNHAESIVAKIQALAVGQRVEGEPDGN